MTQKIVELAMQAAQEKKAIRINPLDLAGKSDVCDIQLICSGNNTRHTVAIADEIEGQLKKQLRVRPLAIEGKNNGHWIALDYGSMIIHIFTDELRDFYAIEDIWKNS